MQASWRSALRPGKVWVSSSLKRRGSWIPRELSQSLAARGEVSAASFFFHPAASSRQFVGAQTVASQALRARRAKWLQRTEASFSSASNSSSLPLPSFATVSFPSADASRQKSRLSLHRLVGEEEASLGEDASEEVSEDPVSLERFAERALRQGRGEELQRRVLRACAQGVRLTPRVLEAYAEAASASSASPSLFSQRVKTPLKAGLAGNGVQDTLPAAVASAAAAAAVSAVRASQGLASPSAKTSLDGSAHPESAGEGKTAQQAGDPSFWKKFTSRVLPALGLALKNVGRGLFRLVLSPVTAVLLLLGGATEISKQLGGALGGSSSSSWLKEKRADADSIEDTFDSVKGHSEVKRELKEVIEYLRTPEKFTDIGARLPKGVLLHGPPGTGKTLLARAIAGEAGVPFLHATGSDFDEVFVGVGASRVRALFAEARKLGRCVIFIDEIDALAGSRRTPDNATFRQTLNQLLSELDGFRQNEGIVLICATNLLGAVDAALLRPGRVDRIIHVPPPCRQERVELLEFYGSRLRLAKDLDVASFAGLTSGLTGADIANLLNWAAIRAACSAKEEVSRADVEESFDRLKVGNARSAAQVRLQEKTVTAFHEGGHALMCLSTRLAPDLHKASILFRGDALGVTWEAPGEEKYSETLGEALDRLKILLAGKAAEEVAFGGSEVTMGCLSDLQKATRLAVDLVTSFGVGLEGLDAEKEGEASNKRTRESSRKQPQRPSGGEAEAGQGRSGSEAFTLGGDSGFCLQALDGKQLSEGMRSRVEAAAKRLLDAAFSDAVRTLTEKKEELRRIAEALLHYETLTAEEIKAAAAGTLALTGEPAYRAEKKASETLARETISNSQQQTSSGAAGDASSSPTETKLRKAAFPFFSQEGPYRLEPKITTARGR